MVSLAASPARISCTGASSSFETEGTTTTTTTETPITGPSVLTFHLQAMRSVRSLIPLLDRVLVQRVKAETKTAGGIFLPESAVEKLNEAKVLAVGPGALDKDGKRIPMGVAEGDRVLIPQYGGSPLKVGDEEYTLFRDAE